MVLLLDGNSEIGAHVRSNLCYLICLRHLIKLRSHKSDLSEKTYFPLCVRTMFLSSNHGFGKLVFVKKLFVNLPVTCICFSMHKKPKIKFLIQLFFVLFKEENINSTTY